ncbi:MAG: Na(+)/H(+) antiporter subunit B [Verrucomicrobiota bacterium]
MRLNPIVREVSDLLMPAILLFAVYVQLHGDYGPGGGFQAGVIFAAGVILYALVYGLERAQEMMKPHRIKIFTAVGVLLYAGVGVVTMFKGGNYLDYNHLAHDLTDHHAIVKAQEHGILLVELGVGITVASVMIALFYSFAGHQRPFYTFSKKS